MKTNNYLRLVVVSMIMISMASCSKKVDFLNSAMVPSARGDVKVREDKNDNYIIDVDVKHLAEAERLQNPKDVYVVWIETSRNGTQNLGRLKLSNDLRGNLKTVTPYMPTRIFITAESMADIQYPGDDIVLETRGMELNTALRD